MDEEVALVVVVATKTTFPNFLITTDQKKNDLLHRTMTWWSLSTRDLQKGIETLFLSIYEVISMKLIMMLKTARIPRIKIKKLVRMLYVIIKVLKTINLQIMFDYFKVNNYTQIEITFWDRILGNQELCMFIYLHLHAFFRWWCDLFILI